MNDRQRICVILAIFFSGFSLGAFMEKNYSHYVFAGEPPERGISTTAVITDWYDGDTAKATISLKVRLRTLDCWAPEVKGSQRPQGLLSKARVEELAPAGSEVRIFIPTTGRLQDSLTFGRPLAHIWIEQEDGTFLNIGETMVEEGFATKEKVRR